MTKATHRILSLVLALSLCVGTANIAFAQPWFNQVQKEAEFNLLDVQMNFGTYWQDKTPVKGSGWKVFKRMEWFWEQRLYPDGNLPDFNKIYTDWNKYKDNKLTNDKMQLNANWTFLGPTIKPQQSPGKTPPGIGRINCVAFDPINANVIWAGAAFAGVWKSTDGGNSWATFAQTDFMSVGVSDIAVNPSNGSIVYAAMGDAESAGFFGQNFSYSIGILKTTDGGTSWSETGLKFPQSTNLLINRLLINPQNPNILYAAANTGVYKTTDAGVSWSQISTEFCRDIEFKSSDPGIIFGAMYSSGAFTLKKYDANGNQWSSLTVFAVNEVSRINLATTKVDGSVYAVVAGSDMGFHSLLKTTNDGQNWTKVTDKSKSPNYLNFNYDGSGVGGQGMYDLSIAVAPNNSNEIYIGGVNIWRSDNGGTKFDICAEWTGGYGVPWVHADIHYLTFDPNGTLFAAHDGGVSKTTNAGGRWTDISSGLAVMQFYRLATSRTDADFIIAGAQDNGTNRLDNGIWKNIQGGDGMECLIDYTDNKYVYASLYYGELTRSTDGGVSFSDMLDYQTSGEQGGWVTPMIMHPTDPKILYAGLQNIWKTTDRGLNWGRLTNFGGGIFRALTIAPSNPNYLYASSGNQLLSSSNGGVNWNLMTTASKMITYICVDPKVHNRLWIALSGYTSGSKVMKFENGNWSNISGTLPNVPVNCIVYQTGSADRLYIGTDVGVFTRDRNSIDWEPFQTGMPPVVVNELEIHYGSSKLRAATYARGLWETKLSDCNLSSPAVIVTGKTSFCIGDSVILECTGSFVSYKWSSGQTSKKITVKTDGTYSCFVTDSKNCTATSDVINVTVTDPPNITLKVTGKHPFCEGDSIELSGPSLQYRDVLWSDGQTGRKIFVKQAGTITATGTTSNGCSKTSPPFNVEVYPKPTKPSITLSGKDLVSSTAVSYQWFFEGSILSGANQKSLTPSKSGKYQIEIGDDKGCKNISDFYQFGTDDVNELNEISSVNVHPNPTNDFVTVELLGFIDNSASIVLCNILGEEIYRIVTLINNTQSETIIDLKALPKGMYLLKINSDNHSYLKRIIKN